MEFYEVRIHSLCIRLPAVDGGRGFYNRKNNPDDVTVNLSENLHYELGAWGLEDMDIYQAGRV